MSNFDVIVALHEKRVVVSRGHKDIADVPVKDQKVIDLIFTIREEMQKDIDKAYDRGVQDGKRQVIDKAKQRIESALRTL